MKISITLIKRKRIEKGYSQQYVADLMDISQAQYNRLENGKNNFDLEKLSQLLKILELSPLKVLEFSEKQQVFINSKNTIRTNLGDITPLNDADFIRSIVQEELSKK